VTAGRLKGLVLAAAALVTACLEPLPFDEREWARKVEQVDLADLYAPHRDEEGLFCNPWAAGHEMSVWRWFLARDSMAHLAGRELPTPVEESTGRYLADADAPHSVTHVGHATFVVHLGRTVVVTDPFFSDEAVILDRIVPPAFGPEMIPEGAVVLISHNHHDHLDRGSIEALADRARFLCPLGVGDYLRHRGAEQVDELDWWEAVDIDGARLTFLPAQHWSLRIGQEYNESLWGSWMIEAAGRRIYFGGDSGYFKGYREFGRVFPGIDVALLPIGAYRPRWFMHYTHMDVREALRAFEDLGAETMVPTQWGVLELADEPPAWPIVELSQALQVTHQHLEHRVAILPIGGRLLLEK
jgi:L-ascorbate metabolism protein UlaG (beta-lactamase superfamily)